MVIMDYKTAERFARRVGVQRAHRAVVTGVHRLQQIERLGAAHFADDDPFGPHAQTVLNEIAHCNRAASFKVRRSRFKPDDMRLLQLQFGCIFASDHPLVMIDIIGHAIEKSGFAGARPAGNQDIAAHPSDDFENLAAFRRNGAEMDQLIESKRVYGFTACVNHRNQ